MTQTAVNSEKLLSVPIGDLMPDPAQPRRTFLEEEIARLTASVAARGILQPLRVIFDKDRQKYLIICGESRFLAGFRAGLSHLPCLEVDAQLGEAEILTDQLVENIARTDLRPLEQAKGLAKLKALSHKSSQQLADELGLSGASVSKSLALLRLPKEIQAMVEDGRLTADAGYQIAKLPGENDMLELAHQVSSKKLGRQGVVVAVREALGKSKAKAKRKARPSPSLPPLKCGGLVFKVAAVKPLDWAAFNAALASLQERAASLFAAGRDLSELAQ